MTLPTITDPDAVPDYPAYKKLRAAGAQLATLYSWRKHVRVDGRVYPRIELNSTRTGRMKITKPAMQGTPIPLRDLVLAEPGHVIIGVDHHGAEARVMASFINDPDFTAAITTGDPYQDLATATGLQRQVTKVAFLAYAYGQSQASLAKKVGDEAAHTIRTAIKNLWPALPAWMERVTHETEHGNLLHTLTGRPLLPPDAAYKTANLLIQSSARDLYGQGVRRAAIALGTDALWLPIHDELLVLAPRGHQTQIATQLQEAMTIQTPAGIELTGEPEIFGGRWGKHPG